MRQNLHAVKSVSQRWVDGLFSEMHTLQQHERLERKRLRKNLSGALTANQNLAALCLQTGFCESTSPAIDVPETGVWRSPTSMPYLIYRENKNPVEREKQVDILRIWPH